MVCYIGTAGRGKRHSWYGQYIPDSWGMSSFCKCSVFICSWRPGKLNIISISWLYLLIFLLIDDLVLAGGAEAALVSEDALKSEGECNTGGSGTVFSFMNAINTHRPYSKCRPGRIYEKMICLTKAKNQKMRVQLQSVTEVNNYFTN